MDKITSLYKPQGITPVQLIEAFRNSNPEYQDLKIGFAGRLDPLAHGVMLLTIGEENKNRQQYLNLNKTYKFSVLFGVETDSYDYLGELKQLQMLPVPENLDKKIQLFIKSHTGILTQPYPPFSSKTINGIQLYKLAKRGKLDLKDLPLREIEISSFSLLSVESKPGSDIHKEIYRNLNKITGHFRQIKIIKLWKDFFKLNPDQNFTLANFEVECSSGTYIRNLAHKMGREFNCGAIAFEILRTGVGEYFLEDSLKVI